MKKNIERVAGIGSFGALGYVGLLFVAFVVSSPLLITAAELALALFSASWIYLMLDALGAFGGKRKLEWFFGILMLGFIAAPIYWYKEIHGHNVWAEHADAV